MNFKLIILAMILLLMSGCSTSTFLNSPLFNPDSSPPLLSSPIYTTAEGFGLGSFYRQPGAGAGADQDHPGIDIGFVDGGRVKATAPGIVVVIKDSRDYSPLINKEIYVKYNDRYSIVYLLEPPKDILVKVGDYVERGQVIATILLSPARTSPVLHFNLSESGNFFVCPITFFDLATRNQFRELMGSVSGFTDPCYEHTPANGYPNGCPSLHNLW